MPVDRIQKDIPKTEVDPVRHDPASGEGRLAWAESQGDPPRRIVHPPEGDVSREHTSHGGFNDRAEVGGNGAEIKF
jgi:hypothetical protein